MKRLTAVFVCALLLTAAACADVIPDDTVNYEISSYVMRMTLEKNGDVRVRDEIIYNNPGSYDGYAHRVNLDGAQGIGDIAVWTDGEALSQTSEGEEAGFEAAIADGEAVIEIGSGAFSAPRARPGAPRRRRRRLPPRARASGPARALP